MINLRVEMQPGRCQLSAPSMHKAKTGVQNMYMKYTSTSPRISVMKERLSHFFVCCCVQVEFLSSYKVCTRGNVTLATAHSRRLPQKTKWIIFLKKTPSNSDETGPGKRTREGDHRLKV